MKLVKPLLAAAATATLAFATSEAVLAADTVTRTYTPDGANTVYIGNQVQPPFEADISGANQGSVCHGINRDASGTPQGITISGINNDTNRVFYSFTGPNCDGYFHNAHPGQVTHVSNSTNTGDLVLVKSYYFR